MKERIDILLVERRLVESRAKAQWLIKQGLVLFGGKLITAPEEKVNNAIEIKLKKEFPYVGKGGIKLEAALKKFGINVEDKICADVGASIGGFTDCLLKHGALKVYAIDTATDLLHPSLRCEKAKDQVIPLLGIDARDMKNMKNLKILMEKVDICTIDITFTSIRVVLPNVKVFLKKNGDIISLIKPLFEIESKDKRNLEIISDSGELKSILLKIISWSIKNKFYPQAIMRSPLLGKGGSIEFFIHFKTDKKRKNFDYQDEVAKVLSEHNHKQE